MKMDSRRRQNYNHLRAKISRTLPLLLLAGFFAMVMTGCGADAQPATEVTPKDKNMMQSDPALEAGEQISAGALQTAEQVTSTTLPTAIPTTSPTLTAEATATATSQPTLTPTAAPTETAVILPTVPGEPPTPTKLPPLPTPSGVYSWTLKVPVLMYHYISEPPEDADKYRRDLSVTPADFEQQMAYLAKNGYESVDLYDLSLAITAKRDLPEKPVVITLDDGYVDNYENAFEILQDHGMKATFFVVTEFIDEGRAGYLNWDMVEEMAGAGMRIEPHSKTHPDLSTAERDYVIYEVLGSQETIAAHIGYTPRYFCYPGGRYNEETMSILDELGFWGAVTTADGRWHGFKDRFEWSRIRMRDTTTLQEFAGMVNPADTVSGKPSADS